MRWQSYDFSLKKAKFGIKRANIYEYVFFWIASFLAMTAYATVIARNEVTKQSRNHIKPCYPY